MKTINFTIEGDPRTKKNSQIIAGTGRRCPTCGKFAKQWIKQSAQHDEWNASANWQIRLQKIGIERQGTIFPIDERVNVKAVFYLKTQRRVDLLNLLAAVDDLLVETHVLFDDNIKIVATHDGSEAFFDKERPRVEIEITPKGEKNAN